MAQRLRFNSISIRRNSEAQFKIDEDETLLEERKKLSIILKRFYEALQTVTML